MAKERGQEAPYISLVQRDMSIKYRSALGGFKKRQE